jgi:hypothetical protein
MAESAQRFSGCVMTHEKDPFYSITPKSIRVTWKIYWTYLVCLIFATTFVWNILQSYKCLVNYKTATLEMYTETRVGLRLVSVIVRLQAKLRMHQKIWVKLRENPFSVPELLYVNWLTYKHGEVNRCIVAMFHCWHASNYRPSYVCFKLSFPVLRDEHKESWRLKI